MEQMDTGKLKSQYNVGDIPEMSSSATIDRAIWKKVTKLGDKTWDSAVENLWKNLGNTKTRKRPLVNLERTRRGNEKNKQTQEKQSLRQKVDEQEHPKIYGELRKGEG